ncbi:MAG: sigma-70 family RNA polymerase sigma factor [Microthrixaceae bacterium]
MGDADGFDEFYAACRPRLVRALTVACGGDVEAAADATDEALVRALERWKRVRAMPSAEAWVFAVGRNHLRRRFRRRSTERRLLQAHRVLDAEASSAGVAEAMELWAAVAELPTRDREVVAYRYVLGLTEAEVAGALGVATGTVSAALSRARTRLRSQLAEEVAR